MNLSLAVKEIFEGDEMNIYTNESNDVFMTREQIGQALEYATPRKAISDIHNRNKKRLNKFSVVTKLRTTDGKTYETTIYNEKGIYEIIRYSKQPKADAFYEYQVIQPSTANDKLQIQKQRAEAMLLNARTRQAKLILDMQKNKTLSPIAVELLGINAIEHITGKKADTRPETEKTYTASEIGKELDVSSQKVGKVAKANDLKTEEYGIWALDKSPYSNKQVQSFRYNEKGREKLIELIRG